MRFSVVIYIYPGVENYLSTLIKSLNEQTFKFFQVIIFNDGVSNVEKIFQPLNLEYVIQNLTGTPGEIRYKSLKYLEKLTSDFIVFQDADDFPDSNRLEEIAKVSNEYDLVVNDLAIIDNKNNLLQSSLWSRRLENNFEFTKDFIRDKNIVGLGNTAIRRSFLNHEKLKFSNKPIAFDWFLFYQILVINEIKAVFLSTTKTNYRQHAGNLAGVKEPDKVRCRHVLKVKKMHYEALEEIGFNFESILSELKEVVESLKQSNNFKINTGERDFFWWEETNFIKL